MIHYWAHLLPSVKSMYERGEQSMRMKSIIALMVALVFTLGTVGLTFAADAKDAKEVKGTVAKVDAKSVTIKDAAGKEMKLDAAGCKDVKVGDKVTVKDGKCMKEMPAKKKSSGY